MVSAPGEIGRQRAAVLMVRLADGREVSYAVYGDPDGRPVLALHGAPACRLMFAFADAAARKLGLKLIAPDRPGYAGSTPDTGATLRSRAHWLVAFADAVGLERFTLLGISGGAPYAVAAAVLLKQRVTTMALVSPMGPAADYTACDDGRNEPIQFLQRRFFLHLGQQQWLIRSGAALVGAVARRAPKALLGQSALLAGRADAPTLRKPSVRAGMALMTAEAFRNGGRGAASDLYIYGQPWNVDFTAIRAPCLLWQGTADTIVPVNAARYLARQLPSCRLIELPGAGHFWIIDHMDEVLEELARSA